MPISKASSNAVAPAAKGDLVVGTTTNDSGILAVGSANQVLTVDSSTTTGLKWATASAGLTLITRNSFSNVAGVNLDSIFSASYKAYLISIESFYAATTTDDMLMQLRYGSSTFNSANYYSSTLRTIYSSTTSSVDNYSAATYFNLARASGDSTYRNRGVINITIDGTVRPTMNYHIWTGEWASYIGGGTLDNTSQTWTGLRFLSENTNITGTIAVYGLGV